MNLFTESDWSASGIEQLQPLVGVPRWPDIGKALNFSLTELHVGRVVFEGVPGVDVFNPLGVVHGGFAATLLDSACGAAVHSSLRSDQAYTTVALEVKYHRPITLETGRVRAEGIVVRLGRRIAFAEGRLVDATGILHASATATLLVLPREADRSSASSALQRLKESSNGHSA